MKGKFSMNTFKNIKFVECDKTSDFINLKEMIKSYNLSEIY